MDEKYLQQRVMYNIVRPRFGESDAIHVRKSRGVPKSVDREYRRVINAYLRILKDGLEMYYPRIEEEYRKQYKLEKKEALREDGILDFMNILTAIFNELGNYIERRTAAFRLRDKIDEIAELNRKLTARQWHDEVKQTLAIDIREDYYNGEFFGSMIPVWVDQNVDLIKTIPHDTLGRMKEIIYDGWAGKLTATDMASEIRHEYGVSKYKARFIARDQSAKLNAQITRKQQEDAGVSEYIWDTSGDQRVRPMHQKLEGTKHKWDDPPIVDEKRGRRCHPGEDYQCRCVALAVFDMEDVDLPIDYEKVEKEYGDMAFRY